MIEIIEKPEQNTSPEVSLKNLHRSASSSQTVSFDIDGKQSDSGNKGENSSTGILITNNDCSGQQTFLDKDLSSFDTFSNVRCHETIISAQNTTVASNKVTVVKSTHNIKSKQKLHSANHTTFGKNFQGIEEIPDENSVLAKNENMATSQGRWSSDCPDESLNLNSSQTNEQICAVMAHTSAFTDQFKK